MDLMFKKNSQFLFKLNQKLDLGGHGVQRSCLMLSILLVRMHWDLILKIMGKW